MAYDINANAFTEATMVGLRKKLAPHALIDSAVAISVAAYGAKGDVLEVHDGVTTSGDNTVTSATGYFTAADVGKLIYINGAGVAGALLATTISAYNSATSVEVTVAPSASLSNRKILWGTDDSTAIANAITATVGVQVGAANSYNPGKYGSVIYFPPGRYLHGGITFSTRTRFVGEGAHKSVLVLKPGTAAHCVTVGTTDGNSADFQEMWHMGIDGTRRFKTSLSRVYHGIYLFSDADTKDETDRFHRFCHLKIWQTDGCGIKTESSASDGKLVRGESLFFDINIQTASSYGADIVMSDSRFVQVHAGGCDMPGFKVYTQSCQFIGCKSYYNAMKGVYDESLTHEAEGSNWIVGGFSNQFISCQAEESYSSNWYICGSKNIFVGCLSDDAGDLPDNESTTPYTGDVAGFLLRGAIPTGYTYGQAPTAWADYDAADNNFVNCFVGITENNGGYHMKHAVMVKDGAKFNRGTFYTQITNAGGAIANPSYSTAKFGWSAPGGSNKIIVDDVKVATGLDASDTEAFWSNYQTASYVLGIYDAEKTVFMHVGSANNLTVPPNSSVPFPIGTRIEIVQSNTGQTTLDPGVGVTINGTPGLKISARYGRAELLKVGANAWYAFGDLSA